MAISRAKLKFKSDISADMKMRLKALGFLYYSGGPDWLIYTKYMGHTSGIVHPQPDFRGLPEAKQAELAGRCNKIADCFKEPETHKDVIRMRITNMARTLEPREREWVMDWIKRVIDEDDT